MSFYSIVDFICNFLHPCLATGAALVFVGLIGNTLFGVALFFPNHELVEPDADVAKAIEYTKLHPPVDRDSFYVVSAEILDEWNQRPEAWNFEVSPWGPNVIVQTETVPLMSPHDLLPMPFMLPLADQDVDAYTTEQTKLEGIASGKIKAEQEVLLGGGDLDRASLANLNAMQLQEAAYKQRVKADQVQIFTNQRF